MFCSSCVLSPLLSLLHLLLICSVSSYLLCFFMMRCPPRSTLFHSTALLHSPVRVRTTVLSLIPSPSLVFLSIFPFYARFLRISSSSGSFFSVPFSSYPVTFFFFYLHAHSPHTPSFPTRRSFDPYPAVISGLFGFLVCRLLLAPP